MYTIIHIEDQVYPYGQFQTFEEAVARLRKYLEEFVNTDSFYENVKDEKTARKILLAEFEELAAIEKYYLDLDIGLILIDYTDAYNYYRIVIAEIGESEDY